MILGDVSTGVFVCAHVRVCTSIYTYLHLHNSRWVGHEVDDGWGQSIYMCVCVNLLPYGNSHIPTQLMPTPIRVATYYDIVMSQHY